MTAEEGPLATTAKSLRILKSVATREGATLRELVEETGLAKSTVHKHLETLRANEYLIKNGEQYGLSLRHLTLGKRAIDSRPAYNLVEQKVHELGSRTDAEVDFTVEENGRLVLIFEAVGRTNASTFGIGSEFHLHNTAAGKAMLAEYSADRVRAILDRHGMPQTTPNTIQSREPLKEEFKTIRERGFALNDGECVEGYRTVSSVITNPDGSLLGAISAGGPVYRINKSRLGDELADKVCEVTNSISEELASGYETASFDYRNQ